MFNFCVTGGPVHSSNDRMLDELGQPEGKGSVPYLRELLEVEMTKTEPKNL